jgi:CBS domain containing-hemolysin-like protein
VLSNFVIVFALFKIVYILFYTFKRLTAHLRECCSFYDLVAVYGIVIGLIVFSFAADYYCLQNCLPDAFSGLEPANGKTGQAFDFIYFSVVTFATIGFGDITPLLMKAKLLVVLEITTSFIMIFFVISNFDKIYQPNKG